VKQRSAGAVRRWCVGHAACDSLRSTAWHRPPDRRHRYRGRSVKVTRPYAYGPLWLARTPTIPLHAARNRAL